MPSVQLSEFVAYRGLTKRLLSIIGLWPHAQPSFFYRSLPILQLLLFICASLTILGYVIKNFTDVALVTKGMSLMIGYLTCALKTTCMLINRKAAKKIHQLLDPHFNKLVNNPQLSSIVLEGVTIFRRLSALLSYCSYLTCFVYCTMPIAFIIYQYIVHIHPIKYLLILPGVYPWEIEPNGFVYKIHYICESMAAVMMIVTGCGMDSLFSLYIFQMVGQLRVMGFRIMAIDEKSDYKSVIRENVLQYEILLEAKKILEQIYGPIVGWTMVINAIIICSQMFEFVQIMHVSIGRAVIFSAYILFKLLQTFLYAYAAQQLTENSKSYWLAVYSAKWPPINQKTNKSFMTSVLIMLTQKPLVITACKFSIISLDIFTVVLNRSVSYFFLLQTLDDKSIK